MLVIFVAGLVLLTGCKPAPEISKYTAPHEADENDPPPDVPEDPASGERILGLIVPGHLESGKPQWWFFKMRGRPQALGRRVKPLEEFASTLKMPADEGMPTYNLPAGWVHTRSSNQFALVSIRTGHRYTPLSMDVSKAGGELAENVNRWRDQVGLKRLSVDEIPGSVREITIGDGTKAYWVDITGPGGSKPPFAKP
jgi:hypothetical protein